MLLHSIDTLRPLEVLRISTVVDHKIPGSVHQTFGSAKNFYCCRSLFPSITVIPLEVLRISTVVDPAYTIVCGLFLWKC